MKNNSFKIQEGKIETKKEKNDKKKQRKTEKLKTKKKRRKTTRTPDKRFFQDIFAFFTFPSNTLLYTSSKLFFLHCFDVFEFDWVTKLGCFRLLI